MVAGRVASFSAPGAAPKPSPETKMAARAVVPEPSAENEVVVTGRRREETLQSVPTAVTAISSDSLDQADGIVVTGSRVSRGRGDAAWRRGDWNACTVNDPGHSLRGCKSLVNPAAKGDTGIAAARVSDGLASAWRGEWDDAILAFDQAIALRPSFAFAYLNRALARQRKGDLAGAAADLDLAVRHAPHSARGYYHRSVLRQQMGDPRRARQDEGRAVDLDPDYADLFE